MLTQIDGDEQPKPPMKKEHIHLVIFTIVRQDVLIADVCKPLTEFKKKLLYLLNQSPLKLQFEKRLRYSEKSK